MTDAAFLPISIVPVVNEKRGGERRADWHTPEDCPLAEKVQKRFGDGTERMERIEKSIEELKTVQASIVATNAMASTSIAELKYGQAKMAETHKRFEAKLDANTETTEKSTAQNSEILETVTNIKDLVKGTKILGDIVKWVCGIAAAVVGLYLTWKTGKSL